MYNYFIYCCSIAANKALLKYYYLNKVVDAKTEMKYALKALIKYYMTEYMEQL